MHLRLGHIAIRVKDFDKVADFYCNKLGLNEAFRIYNKDGSLRIVFIHISDNQYIEVCVGGNKRIKFDDVNSIGVRHISFTVKNLLAFKKYAEKNGAVFDSEILKLIDNNLTIYLFDPEGNKIEIVETKKDSPHWKFQNQTK